MYTTQSIASAIKARSQVEVQDFVPLLNIFSGILVGGLMAIKDFILVTCSILLLVTVVSGMAQPNFEIDNNSAQINDRGVAIESSDR